MIRLVQRQLIIPRGDTGTFSIPVIAEVGNSDASVFTIFNPLVHKKIFQKEMIEENGVLTLTLNHGDTVNLPVGEYVWDIKFYKNVVKVDDVFVTGDEVSSYYAAFKLPVCEIRQTGDTLLTAEEAPTATIAPEYLSLLDSMSRLANDAQLSASRDAATAEAKAGEAAESASTAADTLQTMRDLLPTIPTKVSQLENDRGYLTQHQDISGKANIEDLSTVATSGLYNDLLNKPVIPTTISQLIDDSNHYIKPANGIPASDLEETYLTSFTETDPTVPAWAKALTKPTYTAQEVGALPSDTFIPTDLGDLTNNAGYLTQHQDISGKANSADLATVATSGSYNDLINKPTIPTVPTNVSAFTNDAGYGTYTKPLNGIPASDLANGVLDVWSGLTYHTSTMSTDSDSFVLGGATDAPTEINKCLVTSDPSANVIPKFDYQGRLHSVTPEEEWDGSNAVATTEYVDNMISNNMPEIPTDVSEFNNDAGYLTSFTETDPTVPSWAKAAQKPSYTAAEVGAPTVQEMNTAINNAIGNINSFDIAVVQELPIQDISTHTIYLVPKTGVTNDVYDEYIRVNNGWEMIGNTQIDLSNYVQKTDYATDSSAGVVKVAPVFGIGSYNGYLTIAPANDAAIKTGVGNIATITAASQHQSVFYGLAKAAGDTTQAVSDNAVGTYTDNAKTSIRTMLGAVGSTDYATPDVAGIVRFNATSGFSIGARGAIFLDAATPEEVKAGTITYKSLTPYTANSTAFYGLAKAAGDTTQAASDNVIGTYTDSAKAAIRTMLGAAAASDIPNVPVTDVQMNGTSIVSNNIANVPTANWTTYGVVKTSSTYGITAAGLNDGTLKISAANQEQIKTGTDSYRPITPIYQNEAVFYGLSKLAGVDLKNETVTVGTYPETSKAAIKTMLGIEEGLQVVRLI